VLVLVLHSDARLRANAQVHANILQLGELLWGGGLANKHDASVRLRSQRNDSFVGRCWGGVDVRSEKSFSGREDADVATASLTALLCSTVGKRRENKS
jgi:hypothetical protein